MPATNFCPQCGLRLGTDAPEGLCPQCLLLEALQSDSDFDLDTRLTHDLTPAKGVSLIQRAGGC